MDEEPKILPPSEEITPLRIIQGEGQPEDVSMEVRPVPPEDVAPIGEMDKQLGEMLRQIGRIEVQISELARQKFEVLQQYRDLNSKTMLLLEHLAKKAKIDIKNQGWTLEIQANQFRRTK